VSFEKLHKMLPQNTEVLYHLAQCCDVMENFEGVSSMCLLLSCSFICMQSLQSIYEISGWHCAKLSTTAVWAHSICLTHYALGQCDRPAFHKLTEKNVWPRSNVDGLE